MFSYQKDLQKRARDTVPSNAIATGHLLPNGITRKMSQQDDIKPLAEDSVPQPMRKLTSTFRTPSVINRSAFAASGGAALPGRVGSNAAAEGASVGGARHGSGGSPSSGVLGPSKRRRLLPDGTYTFAPSESSIATAFSPQQRGLMRSGSNGALGAGSKNGNGGENGSIQSGSSSSALGAAPTIPGGVPKRPEVYEVTWRKPQYKKHKTWDGDAMLIVRRENASAVLKCIDTKAE